MPRGPARTDLPQIYYTKLKYIGGQKNKLEYLGMLGQAVSAEFLLGKIEKLIAKGEDDDTVTAQVLNYAVHDIFSSTETSSGYYIERVLHDSGYVKAALTAFFLRIVWLAKAKEFTSEEDFNTLREKVREGEEIYKRYEGSVDVVHYDRPLTTLTALVPKETFEMLITLSQKMAVSGIINSLNSSSVYDWVHE